MKSIIFFLTLFNYLTILSQKIDFNNFNSDIMNKVMLKEFNNFRKINNLDTLLYSNSLFNIISKPNCVEVADSSEKTSVSVFYHPELYGKAINPKLKTGMISEYKLYNNKLNTINGFTVYENAFKTEVKLSNYQDMAKYAIYCWSQSVEHAKTQNLNFKNLGVCGLYSCHSSYTKNNELYIYINFIKIK